MVGEAEEPGTGTGMKTIADLDRDASSRIEKIEKEVAEEKRTAPPADDAPAGDPDAPAGDDAGAIVLDDGTKVSKAELAEWRASHAERQAETERSFKDKHAEAQARLDKILQDPSEYDKARQEQGAAKPNVIDPLESEDQWRLVRAQEYRQYVREHGVQNVTEESIAIAVEKDYNTASRNALREQAVTNKRELDAAKREATEAREERELDAALKPLYDRYPGADFPKGRELVGALLAQQVAKGKPVNLEDAVRTIHDLSGTTIKSYAERKRAMATATRAISPGGGSPPVPVPEHRKGSGSLDDMDTYVERKGWNRK